MRTLRNNRAALPALLVLALGVGLAAWAGLRQHAGNQARIEAALSAAAERATEDLTARFRLYQYGLRGARGAIITGGVDVSRAKFRRYSESRDVDVEFPGARGFGFIARVPQSREDAFRRVARADGAPDFTVRQLTPHDGERFIIRYIEPQARSAPAVGLDIASEARRREAALTAMRSGQATLTAPITLVQAIGKPKGSMLFLLPVYDGVQNRPAATREAACIGWVYAPLVTDDILAGFEQMHATYGFTLTDLGSNTRFFATRHDSGHAARRSRDFAVYGRTWRVVVEARPAFVAGLGLPDARITALLIATVGLMLSLGLYQMLVSSARRRSADNARRRLAAIVESSQDAIIGTTLDGRVTEWNRAAVRMFGYDAADALGRTKIELIVPYERAREDLRILTQVTAGHDVDLIETVRRHRDGTLLDVEFSASPIKDSSGRVTGVAAVLRDISERSRAEAAVHDLTVNLELQVEQRTEELQAFSALQRAILDNAGYAIVATGPDGLITLFNPAAEAMLGYASEDLVGRESPAVFHDPLELAVRSHALEQELGRPLASGFEIFIAKALHQPDVNEWTYVTRTGARIPVLLNVSALRDADGGITGYLGIAADLREQKQRDAAIETNERKLRGLFELSPLGIALTDDTGRFVEFNEAFRALTGYDEQVLRGLDYWTLTPREYEPNERALLRAIERTGRYGPYDKHYVRKDGSRIPIRLNGVGLPIDGKPHIWSIVEDITVQRTAEAAMVDAVAAAEAASRSKSEFLANMSHEIRTPMNAILGMLQLLQRTALAPRQADYATKTETAARTLLAILNDILDFSKIEAGRQTVESQAFEVESLLRDISVILGANVGDKDIEVVFDIDPQLPPQVIGDSLRLQQVLINLAGNAIKFTHLGEVVLQIRVLERDDVRVLVGFEVRDTGIGIDAAKLETIFEGFSQAEASTTRRFGGTGLGLAISQRLVRLMGGELGVESERGSGSRFHFSLQFALPERATPSPKPASLPGKLRALVVDDHRSARESIAEMIASRGWSAVTAASGEAALDLLASDVDGFDVVFLDWRMPGLDGWETGRRIRAARAGGPHAPLIIMVTAHGREVLAERSVADATLLDGFLVKPVTMSMLVDSVADARAALDGGVAVPRSSPGIARQPRLSGMAVLVVDDNVNNQQVVSELLQDEGARVLVAGGGTEALRLVSGVGHGIDVVLMDIQMPDMDGYTVTRRMRATAHLARLPIIAMTANVLPADRDACLAAGMNDHLGKPFDLDTLVARLRHWTGRGEGSETAALAPAVADTSTTVGRTPAVLDVDAALARFGGNARIYDGALQRFVAGTGPMVDDIARLLGADRRADAARELHTLKGIAGTVGAARLARVAATVETAVDAGSSTGDPLLPLREAVAEAVAAARKARDALPIPDAVPPSAGVAAPADDHALAGLAALLAASNLQALDVFATMQPAIERRDPDVQRDMAAALENLDFGTALAACRRLQTGTETQRDDR